MRRNVARLGRFLLAAALAYLTVGIIWQTAFGLAQAPAPAEEIAPPWEGLLELLAWFVLPSVLWPSSMSTFVPGGAVLAVVLFAVMTALMFGALVRLAPDRSASTEPRRPVRRRSAPRGRAGRPRTS